MGEYLSVSQISEETGLSRHTLYDAIARREMAVLKPNGNRRGWRVARREVERWLREMTRPAAPRGGDAGYEKNGA